MVGYGYKVMLLTADIHVIEKAITGCQINTKIEIL